MKPDIHTDDRGVTGIGTLIIFIALVLAAAIAAGVVLNTTGLLQSKATQTGEDSTKQVSNQLQILATTGNVTIDASGATVVDELNIKVFKSPGADDIAIDEATIQYLSSESDRTLNSSNFSVNALDDDDNSLQDDILNSQVDRAELNINLTAAGLSNLAPGDKVTLRLTTQSGSQTVKIVSVPDTLYAGSQNKVSL